MSPILIMLPGCPKCDMAKRIFEKMGIQCEIIEHISPEYDDYPIIYFNGKRLKYEGFLKEIKEMKENG